MSRSSPPYAWQDKSSASSGCVIATGGGCVTKEENYASLHQNGTIFWRQRELSSLPTDGRPISQSTDLTDLYETRRTLYEHFADHILEPTTTPAAAAEQIISLL